MDSVQSSQSQSTSLDKLIVGHTMQTITVRLLRSWEARNHKRNGELMSLDMLLLDEKKTLIQASIHHRRVHMFKDYLKDGMIYSITNFETVQAYERYKVTDNKLTLRFSDTTEIEEIKDDCTGIKSEKFRLFTYPEFLSLANSNMHLPDVVGQILSIQGSNLEDASSNQKIVLLLLLQDQKTVRITIWDDQASEFRRVFKQTDRKCVVMAATCLNPKLFAGTLCLNSTGATKFYVDNNLKAIRKFKESMGIEDNTCYPEVEETYAGSKQMETWNLQKIMEYISQSNKKEKEAMCVAQVDGISNTNSWHYDSCAKCSKKLGRSETSFVCNTCNNANAIGIVKIELLVGDGSGQTKFVLFDRDAKKLTNKTAEDLTTSEDSNTECDEAPQEIPLCIQQLVGKTMEFQIKITAYNFTATSQAFTVTRVVREIKENQDQGDGERAVKVAHDKKQAVDETANSKKASPERLIKTEDGVIPPTFAVADDEKVSRNKGVAEKGENQTIKAFARKTKHGGKPVKAVEGTNTEAADAQKAKKKRTE